MAIGLLTVEEAKDLLRWRIRSPHFVETTTDVKEAQNEPPSLLTIHRFAQSLWHSQEYKSGKTIVVCASSLPDQITNSALLVGSFMLLSLDVGPQDVIEAFRPMAHLLVPYDDEVTVESCWRALGIAKTQCGWLRPAAQRFDEPIESVDETCIDMEEWAHYDSPLNGGFHVVVPGKLLALDCPSELADGGLWADEGGERRFGAAFYADVFADMGVDVVVRGCEASYDAAAFAARGIGVEDLAVRGAAPSLADIDRFLDVMRRAPGAVAVHGGAGGLGSAAVLVAVWLITAHGFGAGEALAWVKMTHPGAGGLPAAQREARKEDPVPRSLRRLWATVCGSRSCSDVLRCDSFSAGTGCDSAVACAEPVAGTAGAGFLWEATAGLRRNISAPRIFDFLGRC